jgi:hypothetical protein
MSRKDFDFKQFLLEKGEQVGLGVAVTLMVLMLIWSLFVPPHGFFSGSPAAKARELNQSTEQLETALRSNQPKESDLPQQREGKLIDLDTTPLLSDNYPTGTWFEPRMKEDKLRRPPKIYNVEEAVAKVAAVPIDTYLFRFNPDGTVKAVGVLEDKSNRSPLPNAPGGRNLLSPLLGGRGLPGMGSATPNNPYIQRQQRQLMDPTRLGGLQSLMGAADNPEYKFTFIPADTWDPQQGTTAHQLRPLRMAIIAGSFPYKKQMEEHMRRLRLKSIDQVLSETIGEGDKQGPAFDFRGVEVERMEVDADGKPISDWQDPQLKESYQYWLQHTYYPFQEEDPKYAAVMPNDGKGLVMPLLREFRASKAKAPGLSGMMALMMQGGRGPLPPGMARQPETPPTEENKSKYPDVAADLSKIKETLDKLREAQPNQIAQPKLQKPNFGDPFDPRVALAGDNTPPPQPKTTPQAGAANSEQNSYVPEYVLVRFVDVNIDPGKYYRYRFKIKMANPNYQRPDVASPEYKEKETLESSEWYELPQIVKVPEEIFYYVVDEAHGMNRRDLMAIPPESAQYRLLNAKPPSPASEQVVFQFHRWVETTQLSRKESDQIPVGEWAVADRVFVARGEYVGRKVKVDIPIWKFTQNTFILPAEDQKVNRRSGKPNTGIEVDFGQDPPENNLILVDFEGGNRLPVPNSKTTDDCAIEVLMLSPDGKLLARNSAKDTADKERIDRRNAVLKRIQDVREGKGTE